MGGRDVFRTMEGRVCGTILLRPRGRREGATATGFPEAGKKMERRGDVRFKAFGNIGGKDMDSVVQ